MDTELKDTLISDMSTLYDKDILNILADLGCRTPSAYLDGTSRTILSDSIGSKLEDAAREGIILPDNGMSQEVKTVLSCRHDAEEDTMRMIPFIELNHWQRGVFISKDILTGDAVDQNYPPDTSKNRLKGSRRFEGICRSMGET